MPLASDCPYLGLQSNSGFFDFNKTSGCQCSSCNFLPTAATVVPPATPSSTALVPNRPLALSQPPPAIARKSKVEERQANYTPALSTPLNIDKLALELVNHHNHCFVNNLVNALRDGTGIDYLSLQKARVLHNLISVSQHPEVVCTNLAKEIQLGRITGSFPPSPLPNFQCHHIGVVPRKHSAK